MTPALLNMTSSRPIALHREVDRRGDVLLQGHVALDEGGGWTKPVRQAYARFTLDVSDHDLAAFGDKAPRCPGADPAGTTGDKGGLCLEPAPGPARQRDHPWRMSPARETFIHFRVNTMSGPDVFTSSRY